VTGGARARRAASATLAARRTSVRQSLSRFARIMRRWLTPIQNWHAPRGAGNAAVLVFLLASAGFGVVRGGHLPLVTVEFATARDAVANVLGFRITSIAIAGQNELTREEILSTAGITGRTSLLFLDVANVRVRLKAYPWIAEATVLKLYPGRLHIAVTERRAFALWQKDGNVAVIADDGTVLERYVARRFANLPLVVGAGAEHKAKEFLAQIDRFPLVREQVRAAVLVADRRWNLKLRSGLEVRLPKTGVEVALASLVRLDGDKKLLSRDIAAIDLRLPDRVTVRLTDEVWAERETMKKIPKRKGGSA
jgi:cell division protein FtsQ